MTARPMPLELMLPRRAFLGLCGVSVLGAGAVAASVRAAGGPARPADAGSADSLGPSPDRIAAALDYDVQRIFRFVADEVGYDAYPGILRGATGTLWSRAGNSADRAILLASLLRAAARDVRFAVGPLDETAAASLMTASGMDAESVRTHALAAMAGNAAADGATPPPPPTDPASLAIVRGLAAATAANDAASRAWLEDGVTTIVDALATAGIRVPDQVSALPTLEREQHVWVQLADGKDWIDLDPSLPGTQPGAIIATSVTPLSELPAEWHHRVGFRAVVESITGGTLGQSVALDHEEDATTLVGVPVSFMNARAEGLAGFGVTVSGVLSGAMQYLPVLGLGVDSVIGDPITFSGGSGLLPDLGDDGTPSREGEATAQWLEVRVTVPGSEPVVARRTIFDRVGDAARASGTFDIGTLAAPELTTITAGEPEEFLPARAVHLFAVLGGGISGEYYGRAVDPAAVDISLVAHTYHLAREVLAADLGTAHGVRVFADAPHVVSHSVVPHGIADDGELSVTTALDLWHRSVGLGEVPGTTPDAPAAVVAGVLTHVAERIALGQGLPLDPATPAVPSLSVGGIFGAAREQGIGTRVTRATVPADLPYAPEAIARLTAAVASGRIVIAPERPVAIAGGEHVGWWLVDPGTGRTTDELEDGRGTESEEYTVTNIPLTTEAKVIDAFKRYAACLAKYGATIALLLSFEGGLAHEAGLPGLGAVLAGAASVASAANQLLNDPFFRAFC